MNFDRLTHFLDNLVQRGMPAVADPDKGIALSCNMQLRGAPLKHLHPQLRDLCYECLSL